MPSLLEDGTAAPDTGGGLFGLPANFDIGDALGHLYSRVKTALAPEASPLWPLDSPVGTEKVGGDQSVGMPDPNVSPVVGLLGDRPVTAAAHQRALDLASTMAQFGPADVGAIRPGSPSSAFEAMATPPLRPAGATKGALYDIEHGVSDAALDVFNTSPGRVAEKAKLDQNRELWTRADLDRNAVAVYQERLAEPGLTPDGRAKLQRLLDKHLSNAVASQRAAVAAGVDMNTFPRDPWYDRGMSLVPPPLPTE